MDVRVSYLIDAEKLQKDFQIDDALRFDARSLLERLSTRTYEVVSSGAAGQLGFGFMMGYSSGYFLRKVSGYLWQIHVSREEYSFDGLSYDDCPFRSPRS
jgi:hypothetical protein